MTQETGRIAPDEYAVERPLISVVIPAYNASRYVAAAISSVLAQSYRPIDVIVIDDGSTDSTAQVAQSITGVRYAYQPHAGLGAALNRGIELALGNYLAFLDADDLWTEGKLSRQMAALQAHPEVGMIFGHVRQFHDADPEWGDKDPIALRGEPMAGYSKGTMLIRREAFERVGPFETKWRVGDFLDWYARAVEMGLSSLMLPETLLLRRVHPDNMSRLELESKRDYARVLKAALDRRRSVGHERS